VQYIADKYPASKQAPPNGTLERYRLQSALGFINSESTRPPGGLFKPGCPTTSATRILGKLDTRFQQLAVLRNGKDWVANDSYSVADAYLFVVTRWLQKYDIERWPWLAGHFARVKARPAVQKALRRRARLEPRVKRTLRRPLSDPKRTFDTATCHYGTATRPLGSSLAVSPAIGTQARRRGYGGAGA
jgi:glutathione S-transferase